MNNDIYKKNLRRRKLELESLLNESSNEKQEEMTKLRSSLAMVDEAMSRLEDDMYGYCLICDDELDRRILMKYPETTICKNCKSKR
jgi:RNA polymerase-binding transcription factor DksA